MITFFSLFRSRHRTAWQCFYSTISRLNTPWYLFTDFSQAIVFALYSTTVCSTVQFSSSSYSYRPGHATILSRQHDHVFRLNTTQLLFIAILLNLFGYPIYTPRYKYFFKFFLVHDALLRCRVIVVAKLKNCRVSSSARTFVLGAGWLVQDTWGQSGETAQYEQVLPFMAYKTV